MREAARALSAAERRRRAGVIGGMDDLLGALQWPAMAVTLLASWLVGSQSRRKRNWGFWCFIAGNVLWVA